MKIKFTIILSLWLVFLKQAQADAPLHFTIQLTNTIYYLGESIPIEITYKNTGAWPIKFPKVLDPDLILGMYKLERLKTPQDKGHEMCEASRPLPLIEFDAIEENWINLKPNEKYTIKTDLKDLLEFWQLTPGTYKLRLVYYRYFHVLEEEKFRSAKNQEGKKNWPSEPFTITLRAPRTIQAYKKTKENVLKLTVHPTNITATIGEMIPIGLTFKNISKHRIKFTTAFQIFTGDDDFFYLERFTTPEDQGDEIVYSPKGLGVGGFITNPEFNERLLPDEDFSTTINLQKWVELCHLKPGTHRLVLVFKYPVTIYEAEGKEGEHVERRHDRRHAIWPSEPFTLTLKAPKSPTSTESSK